MFTRKTPREVRPMTPGSKLISAYRPVSGWRILVGGFGLGVATVGLIALLIFVAARLL